MSDLVVLALKLLFLALLWLFVLFVGNVVRTDMFGRKLATNEAGELRPVSELKKQKRRSSRPEGSASARSRVPTGARAEGESSGR